MLVGSAKSAFRPSSAFAFDGHFRGGEYDYKYTISFPEMTEHSIGHFRGGRGKPRISRTFHRLPRTVGSASVPTGGRAALVGSAISVVICPSFHHAPGHLCLFLPGQRPPSVTSGTTLSEITVSINGLLPGGRGKPRKSRTFYPPPLLHQRKRVAQLPIARNNLAQGVSFH
jgi:hypothetical protein